MNTNADESRFVKLFRSDLSPLENLNNAFSFQGNRAALTLAFISPSADFSATTKLLVAQAADTPVVAVMTAGELCESPLMEGSLYLDGFGDKKSFVLQSFSQELIENISIHTIPLHNEDIKNGKSRISRHERLSLIRSSLENIIVPFPINFRDTFALTFVDGVSSCENYLMEAVYQAGLFPCLFIGGSAGGQFDFKSTLIFNGEEIIENNAVVIFVKLARNVRYSVFKSQNFVRGNKSFVAMNADPNHRTVSTVVDPKTSTILPAEVAVGNILSCERHQIEEALKTHTFGIDIDGDIFIRSVAGVNHDTGVVSFYCDVNTGDRLYLLDKVDFAQRTKDDYKKFLDGKPKPIAGILNDCILRRINNSEYLDELNRLWECPVAGFSTFGELFGINVNQTLSAIFFFDVSDGKEFSDPYLDMFPIQYGRYCSYFASARFSRIDLLNRLRAHTSQSLVDQLAEMSGDAEEISAITEQARIEKELRASQRRLEVVTSSLFDGVLLVDGSGQVIFANPAARILLDVHEESSRDLDSLIKLVVDGIAHPFTEAALEKAIAQKGAFTNDDAIFELASGQRTAVAYVVSPIREDCGIEGIVVSFRSIEALKRAQKEALQASRLASVGQLAAGIAHEINTPIQYIGDNLKFILSSLSEISGIFEQIRGLAANKRLSDEDGIRINNVLEQNDLDYLLEELPVATSQSLEGAERVAHIVKSMKEFSHPGTTTKTVVDINRAIESTVTISRNEWRHVATLEQHLDPNLPSVECFAADINQVLLNLIVNAAQALAEAHSETKGLGQILVSTRLDGEYAEIRVADNGPGVPPAIRHQIFDPFFTTKDVGKGTGQGLSICIDIVVNKHKGKLFLDDTVPSGATFVVRLPIKSPVERASGG